MKNGKMAWIITFTLLSIGITTFLGCGKWHHCGYCGSPQKQGDRMVKMISKELNLSEEQKAAVVKLESDIVAKSQTMKEIRTSCMDEVIMQFELPAFDKERARTTLDANEAKMNELKTFMVDELAKFHAILTPDQRAQLVAKMKKHKEDCNSGHCSK